MKKNLFLAILFSSIYANAQVESIDENFYSFPVDLVGQGGAYGHLPYGGWSSDKAYPNAFITAHSSNGNKYLKAYSFMEPDSPITFFSPELVSIAGTLTFQSSSTGGKLQLGVVSSPDQATSFSLVQELNLSPTAANFTVEIPDVTDAKHIAFRYVPSASHRVFGIDNVVFTPVGASIETVQEEKVHLYTTNGTLIIEGNTFVKAQVYSINGALVQSVDLREQQMVPMQKQTPGVYVALLEKEDGKIVSSKFILK